MSTFINNLLFQSVTVVVNSFLAGMTQNKPSAIKTYM